ncbi:MAG: hypothetical protein WCF94_02100 [bacterium]
MHPEKAFLDNTPKVEEIPQKPIETPKPTEAKENDIEKKNNKVDAIFDELLNRVKDSPEAQRVALNVLISQMREIGQQMKEVRDLKHLQEMKVLMMKNWKELKELAGGDPNILTAIKEWGKSFVERKIMQYELLEGVKDELIEMSQAMDEEYASVRVELGKIEGLISSAGGRFDSDSYLRRLDIDEIVNGSGDISWGSGLAEFIASLNNIETGHAEDIDLSKATFFRTNITEMLGGMVTAAYTGHRGPSPVEKYPELLKMIEGVTEKVNSISDKINNVSKIYKVVKKIRDTHYLDLYNEQPDEVFE